MELDDLRIDVNGSLAGRVDLLRLIRENIDRYWDVMVVDGFKEWERPAVFLTEYLLESMERIYSPLITETSDEYTVDFTWRQADYEALCALLPQACHRPEKPPEQREWERQEEMLPIADLIAMAVEVGIEVVRPSTPVARATDPGTSWEAAKSVKNVTETHRKIIEILRHGAHTDADLYALYLRGRRMFEWPMVSESGLRTRRKELVDMGKVAPTGELRRVHTGRRARVWGLVPEK